MHFFIYLHGYLYWNKGNLHMFWSFRDWPRNSVLGESDKVLDTHHTDSGTHCFV